MWTKLYCYSSFAACPLPESKQFIPISVAPTYLSTPHPPPPHSHPTRHSESAGCPSNLTFSTFNHSQTLKCVTNMLIKRGIEKFKELLESLSFLKKFWSRLFINLQYLNMFAMFAGQSAECPSVLRGVQATNFSLSFPPAKCPPGWWWCLWGW